MPYRGRQRHASDARVNARKRHYGVDMMKSHCAASLLDIASMRRDLASMRLDYRIFAHASLVQGLNDGVNRPITALLLISLASYAAQS